MMENLSTLQGSWGVIPHLKSPQIEPMFMSVLCNLCPLSWALEPHLRWVMVLGAEVRWRKGVKIEVVRDLGIGPDFTNCWISVFPPVQWDPMPLECFLFLIIYRFWNSKALPLLYEGPSLPFPRMGILNYFIYPSSFPVLFSLPFLNTFYLNSS